MWRRKLSSCSATIGNRSVRKHARLKYTIETHGLDWFRTEVESRLGYKLGPADTPVFTGRGDRYGWVEGDNGAWHVTLFIESGRIKDLGQRSACRPACARSPRMLDGGVIILTPNQNLTIANHYASAETGGRGIACRAWHGDDGR